MRIISFILLIKRIVLPHYVKSALEVLKQEHLLVNSNLQIREPYSLHISKNVSINIASGVEFRSFCNIMLYENGKLTIGSNVFFNNYCSINCLGEIWIGENTLFGEGVKLYDHNHLYSVENGELKVQREKFKVGYLSIGKNCWIGSNVIILANVVIGDNVIIGANNLIYKDIPSNVIVKAKVNVSISLPSN